MADSISGKLLEIQRDLKVEKGQWNDFSKFYYRSKEDILEAVKPLAHERGCIVLCNDEPVCESNGWVFIKATATLVDAESGEGVSACGLAREPETKKGMDASQITGTASSYAGKRALGNLFAIDDTKDSDSQKGHAEEKPSGPFIGKCQVCGSRYQFQTYEQMQRCQCPQCGGTEFRPE